MGGAKDFGKSILSKTEKSAKKTFSKENTSNTNKSFNDEANETFSKENMDKFGDWSKTQSQLMGDNIEDAKNQIKKSSSALNEQMDVFLLPVIIIGGLLVAAVVYEKLK